jgi:hypothetical protein
VASHHLVVFFTPTSGEKYSFICARCDLQSVTAKYLTILLRRLFRELELAGLTSVSLSFDGAAENRTFARMVCTISAGTLVSEHVLLAAARAVVGAAAERHPNARKGATRTAGERATGATVDEGYGDDDAAIAAAMDDDERRDEQRSIAAVGGSTEADWTKTSPDEETRAEIRELAKALGKILVGWNHTASGVPRTVIIVPDTPHVRGFCLSLC